MLKQINITDAELPIMKVLWEKGSITSPEIFDGIAGAKNKNKSTLKTLLLRLVQKKAVGYEEINSRNYRYTALVSQAQYINQNRKSFLKRAFDGSTQQMLLNFVKEEKITEEDLKQLIEMIKEK
jgi:BlaI family penicillinase repressor